MTARDTDSPAPVAAARIFALYQSVKSLHQRTGGDPAEAAFELIVAACIVMHEARPARAVPGIIADVAKDADTCAKEWFADLIAQFKRGDQ